MAAKPGAKKKGVSMEEKLKALLAAEREKELEHLAWAGFNVGPGAPSGAPHGARPPAVVTAAPVATPSVAGMPAPASTVPGRAPPPPREAPRPPERPAPATPVAAASTLESEARLRSAGRLPLQRLRVVHGTVAVRPQPTMSGEATATLQRGTVVEAVEETFDGWARLLDPPGWVLQEVRGDGGAHLLLRREGGEPVLAASERAPAPGEHLFEVASHEGCAMHAEPTDDAAVSEMLNFGESVLAETQTYHGWVRLAHGEGWMKARTAEGEQLLHCVYMLQKARRKDECYEEARREEEQRQAAAEEALQRELEAGRNSGVWEKLAASSSSSSRPGPEQLYPRRGEVGRFKFKGDAELFAQVHGIQRWNFLNLPEIAFKVHSKISALREPCFGSPVLGELPAGSHVSAFEETFDGWVHLANQAGWAPKEVGGQEVLQLLGDAEGQAALRLAAPDFAPGGPARRLFEVVYEPSVRILREPRADGIIVGAVPAGGFVLAEAQTYHGWIRLADGGWMLSSSAEGVLLQPVSAEEHAAPPLRLMAPEA